MRVLLSHTGTQGECLIATSVIKGLQARYQDVKIDCFVKDETTAEIFKYNQYVNMVTDDITDVLNQQYDLLVNLHPDMSKVTCEGIQAKETVGFHFAKESDAFIANLYGSKRTKMSLFQIYSRLAGLTWKGEGFQLKYYPKSRQKRNRTGLAIANVNLRKYIVDKLKLDMSNIWYVPFKNSLFKRIDEVNRCKYLITDDFLTLNAGLFLRKEVFFLMDVPYNTRIELFGSGTIYKVPTSIIQWST